MTPWSGDRTRSAPPVSWFPARSSTSPPLAAGCDRVSITRAGEASVNLLGCVLFGISAVTSYAPRHAGALISTGVSNWTTTLGAACFLACAVTACGLGATLKAPRLRRLRNLPRVVTSAVEHEVQEIRASVEVLTETVIQEIRAVE